MPRAVVPFLFASRGITGERDPSRIKTGDLIAADNLDFSTGNLLQKTGGSVKVNAVALSGAPSVMTGIEWVPTSSVTRRVIATSDGKLYKDDMSGNFATTLKSGMAAFATAWTLEAGLEVAGNSRKLFIFTDTNATQVLAADGVVTTDVATGSADWAGSNRPSFGFMFRNAVIAGGNANAPHRLYSSQVTNHENFTGAGSFALNVYPGESHRLVGGISSISRGFLWKYPNGIYWINDADASSANWFVQPATRQFGAADTPHAITQVDQGTVAFITASGDLVLMQETSGSLSGVEFVNLTKALNLRNYMRNNFSSARLKNIQVKWYEDKKELHICWAKLGSSAEDSRMVVDFNEERTRVYRIDKDSNVSLWFEKDTDGIYRPIIGSNNGFVRKTDQVNRLVDGVAYQFRAQTYPSDFSDINIDYAVKKLFYRLHMEYEPTGNYDVNIDIIVDGRNIGTVTFNQGSAGAQLPFMLPATLGGDDLLRRSRDIAGEGYYLGLIVREATDKNPRIARAWVEFMTLTPAR